MRPTARKLLTIMLAAIAFAAVAPPNAAHAANVVGPRWSGTTIRYYETLHPSYDWSLSAATLAWNRTGVRTRFVRVTQRSQAQFVIRMGPSPFAAYASIGRQRGAELKINGPANSRLPALNRVEMAALLAHELGHVLGLDHPRLLRCTLMQPNVKQCQPSSRKGYYGCRLVQADDLAGALRLYGGRAKPVPRDCLIDPVAPPLRAVTFSGGRDAGSPVKLTWTGPATLPPVGSKIVLRVGTAPDCARTGPVSSVTAFDLSIRARSWTESEVFGSTQRCYEVQLVNMWGLGAAPARKSMVSWVPLPAAPVVGAITWDAASAEPHFRVPVTLPANSYLKVELAASGACPTAPTSTGQLLGIWEESAGVWAFANQPPGDYCLAFYAVSFDVASAVVPVELHVDA